MSSLIEWLVYAPIWQLHAALLLGLLFIILWLWTNYETKRKTRVSLGQSTPLMGQE